MLPELPKLKKKREANITPLVLSWFRENYPGSAAIEIKATDKMSIPASAVLPHQRAALMDVCGGKSGGLVYKISDEARRQVPFDAFQLQHAGAFVVACFTDPKIRRCLIYDIREWKGAKVGEGSEWWNDSYRSFSL